MSDNRNAPDDADVEGFLREMDWRAPSESLDQRIAKTRAEAPKSSPRKLWWTAGIVAAAAACVTISVLSTPVAVPPMDNTVAVVPEKAVEPAQAAATVKGPVRVERVINASWEDRVQDASKEPFHRIQNQKFRQVIWLDPANKLRVEAVVPEAQYVYLRSDLY